MIQDLRITVLSDNSASAPGLTAEHGLSMLVEADDYRLLFDAGQGTVLRRNVQTLGCRLDGLHAIVLSHGHYDHTGGLAQVLAIAGEPRIYLHPAALDRKFERLDGRPHRDIGIPPASLEAAQAALSRIVWTPAGTEIAAGIWCTGQIPPSAPTGAENGRFFLDEECCNPDPLLDDQAVFLETARGIVVLAGCTHAGVANTLNQVARLTGQERIFAVIGGLHLVDAPPVAWHSAVDALRRSGVQWIAPCHCTGSEACAHLASSFGSRFREAGAGSRFTIR